VEPEKVVSSKGKKTEVKKGGTVIHSYNWRPQNGRTKVLNRFRLSVGPSVLLKLSLAV
jgi:hypothetical protein